MDNETIKSSVTIYAAVLSTLLGGIKLWETFWKDRIRLATTNSFSGQKGAADEITIVNLSNVPVQVSHWELGWKPRLFKRGKPARDVTPDDTSMFKILPKDSQTGLAMLVQQTLAEDPFGGAVFAFRGRRAGLISCFGMFTRVKSQ